MCSTIRISEHKFHTPIPPTHIYFRRDNQKYSSGCEGSILWTLGFYWFLLSFCWFLLLSLIKTKPDDFALTTSCSYGDNCLLLIWLQLCPSTWNNEMLKITYNVLQISGENSQGTIIRTSIVFKLNEGEKFTNRSYEKPENLHLFITIMGSLKMDFIPGKRRTSTDYHSCWPHGQCLTRHKVISSGIRRVHPWWSSRQNLCNKGGNKADLLPCGPGVSQGD